MLELLIPFAAARLYQWNLNQWHRGSPFGFLQDLFVASEFALLYFFLPMGPWIGGLLWVFAAAYQLIGRMARLAYDSLGR